MKHLRAITGVVLFDKLRRDCISYIGLNILRELEKRKKEDVNEKVMSKKGTEG